MLTTILVIVAVLIVALIAFVVTRPDTFRVQRSTKIKARPERIFPLINDFQNWTDWSPWEKLDPAMKRTQSGPPSGKGAVYEWEGNRKVGKGRMEITETNPPSRVTIQLHFVTPFESHNTTDFTLEPEGDSTNVRWVMQGPNLLIGKVMSLVGGMDKMIGKDFEKGLANLKAIAER